MGSGFRSAIKEMKIRYWRNVRHLLCRWHIYNAIRRKCGEYFKRCPGGQAKSELDRFITAFKQVVCAPNVEQMRALWYSLSGGAGGALFPEEAIIYVKREYYDSPLARQFMECYVYDSGNLGQTTTSSNEGNHHAFRNNASIINKPTESYKLRRIHKKQLMQQLRARAKSAQSRIPLDIRNIPELRQLIGKISIFALTYIKRQIMLAKKERLQGNFLEILTRCNCHEFLRYELPCIHLIPIDDSPIPLDDIPSFWRLENWDNGL